MGGGQSLWPARRWRFKLLVREHMGGTTAGSGRGPAWGGGGGRFWPNGSRRAETRVQAGAQPRPHPYHAARSQARGCPRDYAERRNNWVQAMESAHVHAASEPTPTGCNASGAGPGPCLSPGLRQGGHARDSGAGSPRLAAPDLIQVARRPGAGQRLQRGRCAQERKQQRGCARGPCTAPHLWTGDRFRLMPAQRGQVRSCMAGGVRFRAERPAAGALHHKRCRVTRAGPWRTVRPGSAPTAAESTAKASTSSIPGAHTLAMHLGGLPARPLALTKVAEYSKRLKSCVERLCNCCDADQNHPVSV